MKETTLKLPDIVCGGGTDVCDSCAKQCEGMAGGSDFMQRCAEAC